MIYVRGDDGVEMIEILPHQAVSVRCALRLRLLTPEQVEQARREQDQQRKAA
jgi:hypothetical protein